MDKLKSKWFAKDGSIYTKDLVRVKLPTGATIFYPETVAFNVGQKLAEHICNLHNVSTSLRNL